MRDSRQLAARAARVRRRLDALRASLGLFLGLMPAWCPEVGAGEAGEAEGGAPTSRADQALAALAESAEALRQGRHAEALPGLEAARDAAQSELGPDDRVTAGLEDALGTCYAALGRDRDAVLAYGRAWQAVAGKGLAGDEDAFPGAVLRNLAEVHFRARRYAEAARTFEAVVQAWTLAYHGDHFLVGSALFSLGATQLELRRHEAALASLERGLGLLQGAEAGVAAATPLPEPAGGTPKGWHYLDRARASLRRVLPLKRQAYGDSHPEVVRVDRLLADLDALASRLGGTTGSN